jgi:hypothetical protein
MLRGAQACLRSTCAQVSRTSLTPKHSSPFRSTLLPLSFRKFSSQPQQQPKPEETKQQLYSYEKTGPALDFKDDIVEVSSSSDKDKWAGVEPTGFRKKYLHETVMNDIEKLRNNLNAISYRVISKAIGSSKEDKIMLRKLAALLDRTELELQSHQNIWRKYAKPKRKLRM